MNPLQITASADPFQRGLDYLYAIRSLTPDAGMVDLVDDRAHRTPICIWIGNHIDAVNAKLATDLQACHACFHPWEQRSMQIFAVPLAPALGLDGFCNLHTKPITLLVDLGRVVPDDWLALVVHEYAHAHAGSPGHHLGFADALTHLCLGLGIAPPSQATIASGFLKSYPTFRPTIDPLAFWRGEAGTAWQSNSIQLPF